MISDYQRLARLLEGCIASSDDGVQAPASATGVALANIALTFWRNPTRQMIDAARARSPELTVEELRDIFKAVADEVKKMNSE